MIGHLKINLKSSRTSDAGHVVRQHKNLNHSRLRALEELSGNIKTQYKEKEAK